ncbi:helix-turn-helix transcriptional regulator [Micromonospora sp. B11E3]|uniref:helix-turn-helix domain-containing protein n=1 Tax=Micromonospora sp. B11E3 TaxID=3153562 RepID=UPI00325DE086
MELSPMLEHFAEELRLARAVTGLSQAALAEAVSYSAALVAKIEQGDRRPSADFARHCDTVLGTEGRLARIQRRISRESVVPYFREYAGIEDEAVALRGYEPLYVPGLLQTEAYARAVIAAPGLLSAEEVERQVAARLERQEILTREHPPTLTVVLDESVLRRTVGSPELMREQARHLVKVGESLPRVRIHVVPLAVGAYAGLDGPFVIATPPRGEDIVYVEDQLGGKVTDRPEDLRRIVAVWESIRGEALPHQQSIELIARMTEAESWT